MDLRTRRTRADSGGGPPIGTEGVTQVGRHGVVQVGE